MNRYYGTSTIWLPNRKKLKEKSRDLNQNSSRFFSNKNETMFGSGYENCLEFQVLLFLSLIFCKQEKNYCSLGAFQVAPASYYYNYDMKVVKWLFDNMISTICPHRLSLLFDSMICTICPQTIFESCRWISRQTN